MIGEKLGPFQIETKLGQGAMGVVYKATFEPTGQPVAIKVVHQEQVARGRSMDRFERESDILKQFRHPNIVQHIGVGYSRSRDLSYYAMEYVPGPTLEQVLHERGALPWTEVIELGAQICEALQYAHERGVVHRDLKPSNLLITGSGVLKLTDFGIAKDLDRTALTATGRTLGTAAYMAPEQIRGTPEVSHKTDLYSLGCVLYQMLTGETPFDGKSAVVLMHKHIEEPPPRPSSKNPEIPRELDKLVVKLMAKNRDDRPWDAQAVGVSLGELRQKAAGQEPVAMAFDHLPANPARAGTEAPTRAPTSTRTRKTRKLRLPELSEASIPQKRQWIEIGLLGGALAAAVGLATYLLWPPSAAYLYHRVAEGMAKPSRSEWILVRDHELAELERRFPDHPYKAQVQEFKDKILLDQARGRARFLENPSILGATEPRNESERQFQAVYKLAAEKLKDGLDLDALAAWKALVDALPDKDDDRMWFLLARERARQLESDIQSRLDTVHKLLAESLQGEPEKAAKIRREIVDRFHAYQSLRDLVATARTGLSPERPAPSGADQDAP
jgi:serine/threonine-protein kinase